MQGKELLIGANAIPFIDMPFDLRALLSSICLLGCSTVQLAKDLIHPGTSADHCLITADHYRGGALLLRD